MRLLEEKLSPHGARIESNDPSKGDPFTVVTRSGLRVPIAADPDPFVPTTERDLSMPRWLVNHAITNLAELDNFLATTKSDERLSPVGKELKTLEPRQATVVALGFLYGSLEEFNQQTDQHEQDHYEIPPLTEQNLASALRDFEIRTQLRAMSREERGRFMTHLEKDGSKDLLLALLRSPLPTNEVEVRAKEAWRTRNDTERPETRSMIDLRKKTSDWAQRVFDHVVGNFNRIHGFEKPEIYKLVRGDYPKTRQLSPGTRLFGINAEMIAAYERSIQAIGRVV